MFCFVEAETEASASGHELETRGHWAHLKKVSGQHQQKGSNNSLTPRTLLLPGGFQPVN